MSEHEHAWITASTETVMSNGFTDDGIGWTGVDQNRLRVVMVCPDCKQFMAFEATRLSDDA